MTKGANIARMIRRDSASDVCRNRASNVCRCDTRVEVRTLDIYETALFGVKMVLRDAVLEKECKDCGKKIFTIPDQGGLIAAAALTRIKSPLKLTGSEIRFIRKAMEISAKDLSSCLAVTCETLSRWENSKQPMTPAYEKLFRLLASIRLRERAPIIDVDLSMIGKMKFKSVGTEADLPVMVFQRVKYKDLTSGSRISEAYSESIAA